jgi:hypothetical protein
MRYEEEEEKEHKNNSFMETFDITLGGRGFIWMSV